MAVKQSIESITTTMANISVLSVIIFVAFGLLNGQETNVIEIIEETPGTITDEVF